MHSHSKPTEEEYDRILSNPDNVIISEELMGLLEDQPENQHVLVDLSVSEAVYQCRLRSYVQSPVALKLTLEVSNLDFSGLMDAKDISCYISGKKMHFGSSFEYVNDGLSTILIFEKLIGSPEDETRVL